jgi:hypothetical protein
MSLWSYFWPPAALSDLQRAVAQVAFTQVDIVNRLKEIQTIMAADRELLTQLASDMTALATPVQNLIESEAALRARVVELEGQAAADESGDLQAAQAVKDAFDTVAEKFRNEPEVPDVEPLPEAPAGDGGTEVVNPTPGSEGNR